LEYSPLRIMRVNPKNLQHRISGVSAVQRFRAMFRFRSRPLAGASRINHFAALLVNTLHDRNFLCAA
jgi:hypothetical protein